MNKRGLSNIIVTLILIAISLIAVGLIWVTVQNLIESETEQISLGFITVDLEIKDVKVESDGSVKISVGRKIGDGEITGLKFIVSDGINTETIDKENIDLDQLEEKTFTLTSGELGEVVFIKEISVAPVFTLESGKEKIGSVVDRFEKTSMGLDTLEEYGLISWWRFEGNAKDKIRGNDGILRGDVTFVDGKFGKTASFDGIDDYIEVADNPSLDISDNMTVLFWMKAKFLSQIWERMVDKNPGSANTGWEIGREANNNIVIIRTDTSAQVNRNTQIASNVFDDVWHHIAVTLSNGIIKGYHDGVLNLTNSYPHGNGFGNDVSVPLFIGGIVNVFNGQIDEVMIFNKVLTDKQVEALYELDLS